MSLSTIPATVAAVLPTVDPTGGYTPAEFATDLATGVAGILPFVGVAVAGAIGLMFTLIGIKKGISWARSLTSKG